MVYSLGDEARYSTKEHAIFDDWGSNAFGTGLIKDCGNYSVIEGQNGVYTTNCSTKTNIYGQVYVDQFFVNQSFIVEPNSEYFRVEMFAPLTEIIPNLDPNGIYTIEVHVDNTQYRSCSAYFNGAIVQALSYNGTTGGQIRKASDKYFEFVDYTGAALQAMAINGILELDIRFNKSVNNDLSSNDLQIVKIKVTQKHENTQVQLAQRDEAAYTYGFQGMERDDAISGSGNSYHTQFRGYDPRLGRWNL